MGVVEERVRGIAARVAAGYGLEIFDVQYRREGSGMVLRVQIDRPGPAASAEESVSVEDCATMSRDLSAIFDVEDVVPTSYTLEVSSPGLDRPLRRAEDYARFAGRRAKLVMRQPVDGQSYFMGTLGHSYEPVVEAVSRQLSHGTNFTRPAPLEVECAERFLGLVPGAEMVKFCKDGSTAVDAAVRLARAHTGRDMIAICGDHPFFSTSDWFIGTTGMPGGIPHWIREKTVKFRYNDLASLEHLIDAHAGRIACVILEAARTVEPAPGFLSGLKSLCQRNGIVLVFDEMITGFRWHRSGAQHVYGVTPDLSTFGKAIANGFALSAIAGRRELMQLGGIDHDRERVFLLSTTHGAETHALAAGIATMDIYRDEDVTGYLHRQGRRLREGIERIVHELRLEGYFECIGRDCCLLYGTHDADRRPSQPFRTLFLQETIRRGVIAPALVVSYSHSDRDIDLTIEIIGEALAIYRRALTDGVERYLEGRPVKPVFRPFA